MKIIEVNWNWTGVLGKRSKTDYIALHHADSMKCTAQDVDRWHKNRGWAGIGYHFFVRKNGEIYRGRPINTIGAHVSGANSNSIGICAEGDYSVETKMPDAQKIAIAELLDYLKSNFYPNAKIVGHRDIGSSQCPGYYYPLKELQNYKSVINKNESEELTMTQYEELKKEIADLKTKVSERTGYFNYIDDNMNASYKPTIQKLVDEGIIRGNEKGELQLTNDMMRIIVFCDRMINKKN